MKHLYFIVEGETEIEFVNRILIKYFASRGVNTFMNAIPIRIGGGGHGYNNYQHFENTIEPILHKKSNPVITTMFDYYGINSEKKMPNYLHCIQKPTINERIICMEDNLQQIVQQIKPYRFFIPHIQKHELETLLFANPQSGFCFEHPSIMQDVLEISLKHQDIEEINNSPEFAPSKRIADVYASHKKEYKKVNDAIDIIELSGIEQVLLKCQHFKSWIELLIQQVQG